MHGLTLFPVFIPPNSPHAVENLEDTIGVSFNTVPRAGIGDHLYSIIHDRREFGSLELILRYLISQRGSLDVIKENPNEPLYTSLGEYLSQ